MHPFRYIFRRVLVYRMSMPRETDPALRALIATTVLVMIPLICAVALIMDLEGLSDRMGNGLGALLVWLVPLIGAVMFVQYRLWVADGRWVKIAAQEPDESPAQRRFRSILIWCYVAVTAAMMPAAGILVHRAQL
jgi:hypothetical protein